MNARAAIESLRGLHQLWAETRLTLSIAFPWNGGEVVEFAADRNGAVLGIREFYLLSDLPAHQRADFLSLLQSGAVVESISLPPVEETPVPVEHKRRRPLS
jgi:hypothetical protein